MLNLSSQCREIEALRKRTQRTFGMGQITLDQFIEVQEAQNFLGLVLDLAGEESEVDLDDANKLLKNLRTIVIPALQHQVDVLGGTVDATDEA